MAKYDIEANQTKHSCYLNTLLTPDVTVISPQLMKNFKVKLMLISKFTGPLFFLIDEQKFIESQKGGTGKGQG